MAEHPDNNGFSRPSYSAGSPDYVSLNSAQHQLVMSMVNDVIQGRRIAATFVLDSEGNLFEAGSKKCIQRERPTRK